MLASHFFSAKPYVIANFILKGEDIIETSLTFTYTQVVEMNWASPCALCVHEDAEYELLNVW